MENKVWNNEPFAKNKKFPYLTKSCLTQDKNDTNRMAGHNQANTLPTLHRYISVSKTKNETPSNEAEQTRYPFVLTSQHDQ